MFNHSSRNFLFIVLILSLTLAACGPKAVSSPEFTQTEPGTIDDPAPTLTATPAPSRTPTAISSPTETPTATPTPTQPWDAVSLAQTPLPELQGQIGIDNLKFLSPLAIWGGGSPNGIALSPDGQVLAVATNLGAAFYDSLSYIQLALIYTAAPVKAIAFSTDNLEIALGLSNGAVEIIDRADFTTLMSLTNPYPDREEVGEITLSYSPDRYELFQVIATEEDLLIHRWNTTNGQTLAHFSLDSGWTAYTSPSLDMLGVIADEQLLLQSLTYYDEQDSLILPSSIAQAFWTRMISEGGEVAAASSGEFILISNGDSIARWDLLDEEFSYLLDDYPSFIPDACTQAPNTCRNASGGLSWSCEDSLSLAPIELIALTPDDVMVLISRNDNLTEFRSTANNIMPWEIEATFIDVAFSPGGEYFFGLRPDGTIEKRSTEEGTLTDLINLNPSELFDIAFSPDGGVISAAFTDSWIRVFSAGSGDMLGVLTGSARTLQFSPDGALLAAGLEDGTVRIFLLNEGTYYDIPPGHQAAVTSLTFSASGDLLLTGSADCTTSLWNVAGQYRVQNRKTSSQTPFQVSDTLFGSGQQTEFIAGNLTGITLLPDLNTQETLLPEMTIADLALSPNGTTLAVAGESLLLLAIPEGESPNPIRLDEDQSAASFVVAFDPTGTLLADATLEVIRLWSVADSALLAQLPLAAYVSADNPPVTLAFSPVGNLLILATADGLIQVFGIPVDN